MTTMIDSFFPFAATTGSITVRVAVSYLPEQSHPALGRWFWAYHVRVENHGETAVQLLSRHWRISDGRGQIIKNPCKSCHGAGRVEDEKILSVKIPAGVDNGDRIRLAGEGEAGPTGTPPGDLYVEVRVREHDIFQRDGDDLHCEVPIRISQAALGDTVRVPTLGGEAEIRIPSETQTGKLFRLRGKGVKSVRSRNTGDLFCRVAVETPVNLTAEQRELLEQFEATFIGEEGRKHSPKSATFLDGVKSFWDRMIS